MPGDLTLLVFATRGQQLRVQKVSAHALEDLIGLPASQVNDDRLYRALDRLLPHKAALEKHLRTRLGELFALDYDLLLYDVTSTYFEGEAAANPLAQRGYSRDHRPDCKQVNIALVVTREGMPLGYELFTGNRADVTTVKEIVETMERRYGLASRIWVMDRGMASAANLQWLKASGRRYLIGTTRAGLRQFIFRRTSPTGWQSVGEAVEVKLVAGAAGEDSYLLCRSTQRRAKEQGMHQRLPSVSTKALSAWRRVSRGPRGRLSAAPWTDRLDDCWAPTATPQAAT